MAYENEKKSSLPYALIISIFFIVIFVLVLGASYTAVKSARLSAAKASIGHVEAVLLLAEVKALQDGLGQTPKIYPNLIKSYAQENNAALTAYENYIMASMLSTFGKERDFDFAVSRYEDETGPQIQIYFFPYLEQTDVKKDHYYLLKNGKVSENNA